MNDLEIARKVKLLPITDIARKLGIAEQTFYRWTKQYGGLEPRAALVIVRASVVCAFSRYK